MRKLLTLGLASVLVAISFAASAQDAFTTRSVNVRAGPDTSYPPVARLGGGTPVQVMGCIDDWSWCDVVFADNRGWVYAPYLSYVYQGARVAFYTYAPSFGIPIVTFSVGSYWDRYYRGRSWYGRRDYWEHRAPQHVRPSGPPPRATMPAFRERSDIQGRRQTSTHPAYMGNRGSQPGDNRPSRDGGVPSRDYRNPQGTPKAGPNLQGAPKGGSQPSASRPAQEMRRASPTPQGGPPPAAHDGGQRGTEKSRTPEGRKGRGNGGGKQEDKR